MLLPALLLTFAAAMQTSPAPASDKSPIVVTGRGGVPFISPMGEPIRARTPNEDTLARWFNQADRNHDGYLTPDEMQADAVRYFTEFLDTNHDGQIDPDELVHYEWTIAPEIQVNSRLRRARAPGEAPPQEDAEGTDDDHGPGKWRSHRGRGEDPDSGGGRRGRLPPDYGPQGAARYSLLNMPEPVAAADADFNRAITLQEFRQAALDRFQLLDKKHEVRVTLQELEAMKPVLPVGDKRPKHRDDEPDARVGSPLPPGG
jgi:Ca2+-binding EF-hand superfamily protein